MSSHVVSCLLVGVVLCACSTTTAVSANGQTPSATTEGRTIRAEVIDTISAGALWHSRLPVIYRSRGDAVIGYWAASAENEPMNDDWVSPGVVMAGLGDIDEKPVAVRIWTKASDGFLNYQSLADSEGGDDAVALFGGSDGEVRLRLTVKPSGEVYVNGEPIGTIEN